MSRFAELKRLDKKTRNKLRAILSVSDGNAIRGLADLRGKLGKDQSDALDVILNSPAWLRAIRTSTPFPKNPPFVDTLQPARSTDLDKILSLIEVSVESHKERLVRLAERLHEIDQFYSERNLEACLVGLVPGEHAIFDVPAEAGFGQHNPGLVQRIAIGALPVGQDLKENTLIEFTSPEGAEFAGFVRELDGTHALMDFNHPLAGKSLRFEVQIIGLL